MPKKRTGEIPLPGGWEESRDYDGKVFFINHNTQQTTWIDPRDRLTKPQSFADCVGDELPYGWEESYDSQVGVYYIDHINQVNQLEDPRQQWRREQESMLKDYLVTAQDDLEAKKEIYSVKEQRLRLAQDEYQYLNETLSGWKSSSHTSLNSNSSIGSTKYDPDLLKADVNLARKRVARLKHELEQIRAEMQYKQEGLETLARVDQKLSGQPAGYNVTEARAIVQEIQTIQKNLTVGEEERQHLMQSLARLKEDFLLSKNGGSSPDVSTLSIPQEKSTTASQTDLRGDVGLSSSRYLAEIARLRLRYDEAKRKLTDLKRTLTELEDDTVPGQNESDKDRLLLVQEKEQLLRELRSIDQKGRSEDEIANITQSIHKLGVDLNHAKEISNKQIADRLKHQERKTEILKDLAETTKLTTSLESQLKSMSMSTLSMSSGSSLGSLGSLGSLSASSRGSLSSLSMMDIYNQQTSDNSLQELHRRVEKLLQGHSISPIHENPLPATEMAVSDDVMAAATSGYLQSVMASSQAGVGGPEHQAGVSGLELQQPHHHQQQQQQLQQPSIQSVSPHSSMSSSTSPPITPYDMGPPPTYLQHMNYVKPLGTGQVPGPAGLQPQQQQRRVGLAAPGPTVNTLQPQVSSSSQSKLTLDGMALQQSKLESSRTNGSALVVPSVHSLPTEATDTVSFNLPSNVLAKRTPHLENMDSVSNPPLSPISESSSGVCNNLSGGNTRSVSAAVSDESVAGDSGVFEASMKRDVLDEVLEMGLESAQIQIKLKYAGLDGKLHVGIEQARNLTALQVPEGSKICIKAALLPNPVASWETVPNTEIKNPKFVETFHIVIPERMLLTKTLQVNVWRLSKQPDELLGCASVSLADFDPKEVSVRWYNVLSFKFMQSETSVPNKKSTSSSDSSLRDSNFSSHKACSDSSTTNTVTTEYVQVQRESSDKTTKLLEASSARLRKVSHSSDDNIYQGTEPGKDSQFRVHNPLVVSLMEESSDESTIISSQTSTLTRNQGPEEMENHGDSMLRAGLGGDEEEEDEDMEEEDERDYNELDMVEEVIRGFETTLEAALCSSDDGSTEQEDILRIETCDKETNTVGGRYPVRNPRHRSHDATSATRNSTIRRSQTFSPACRPGTKHICKLIRSDSDSSMPLYKRGPFQRNSLERRSLRWKRMPSSVGMREGKVVTRTSLDLELDLQASQTKLSHLNGEIVRLRDLKTRLEQARANGETELPGWMSDDEQFQKLLTEADRLRQREELGQMSKQERRAEQLMKRMTRDIHRMKRNGPNAVSTSFREKMAYITTVNMQVPVLPSDTDEVRMAELLKDGRIGHEV